MIYPEKGEEGNILSTVRAGMVNWILGDRTGVTIIGPATVVKEIKQDPDKIQLYTKEFKKNGRKRR